MYYSIGLNRIGVVIMTFYEHRYQSQLTKYCFILSHCTSSIRSLFDYPGSYYFCRTNIPGSYFPFDICGIGYHFPFIVLAFLGKTFLSLARYKMPIGSPLIAASD
jgi:hypothetical protein